jgi:hypothetical protein
VALTEDGERLLVSSPLSVGRGQIASGSVRIFDYYNKSAGWVEDTSNVIYGDALDEAGMSLALSLDKVVVGAPFANNSMGKVLVRDLPAPASAPFTPTGSSAPSVPYELVKLWCWLLFVLVGL